MQRSLLTAVTVICSAAVGFVFNNTLMMVAGMVLGGIIVNVAANAMSRRSGSWARER